MRLRCTVRAEESSPAYGRHGFAEYTVRRRGCNGHCKQWVVAPRRVIYDAHALQPAVRARVVMNLKQLRTVQRSIGNERNGECTVRSSHGCTRKRHVQYNITEKVYLQKIDLYLLLHFPFECTTWELHSCFSYGSSSSSYCFLQARCLCFLRHACCLFHLCCLLHRCCLLHFACLWYLALLRCVPFQACFPLRCAPFNACFPRLNAFRAYFTAALLLAPLGTIRISAHS